MGDFEDKLNTLLSNPDSMAKIMQMAQSLSGSMGAAQEETVQQSAPSDAVVHAAQPTPSGGVDAAQMLSSLPGGLDAKMLSRLMPLLSEFGSSHSSDTAQLLRALRPFLKPERQEKVERAITLAKIIHLGKKFFTGGTPLV